MPLEEVMQMKEHLALDFRRSGPPEPAVKYVFVDTIVGTEVSRADVIQLLQSLEPKRREEQDEKQVTLQLRLAREETNKSLKRAWMHQIARSKALDRVLHYGEPFISLERFKKDVQQ